MPSASPLIQKARLLVDSTGAAAGFKRGIAGAKGWALSLVGAAAAAAALTKIIGSLNERTTEAIERYQEQEKALIRLEDRFGSATAKIVEQGKELSRLSGASTLAVTESLALAGAMGATEENAAKLALGALNLSAAFGSDLGEASRQLSVTLSGLGGELSEKIPELRALTVEQLKAGGAADVINKKFADAAAQGLTEYERALKAIENAGVDAAAAQGKAAVETDAFREAQEEAVRIADEYARSTENGSAVTSAWAVAVQLSKNALNEFINRAEAAAVNFLPNLSTEFRDNAAAVDEATRALEANAGAARSLTEINAAADAQLEATTALFKGLGVVLDSEVNTKLDENRSKLAQLNEAYQNGTASLADFERAEAALAAQNGELTASVTTLEEAVNQQLDSNFEKLRILDAAYRDGAVSIKEFIRVETLLLDENQRLTASITDQEAFVRSSTTTLTHYSDAFTNTLAAARALSGGLDANSDAIRRNADAAAEADRRAAEREQRRSGGGFLGFEFGGGAGGGTFEFTTATGGAALRAQIERRAGLSAAGPAQPSEINLRGHTVPSVRDVA